MTLIDKLTPFQRGVRSALVRHCGRAPSYHQLNKRGDYRIKWFNVPHNVQEKVGWARHFLRSSGLYLEISTGRYNATTLWIPPIRNVTWLHHDLVKRFGGSNPFDGPTTAVLRDAIEEAGGPNLDLSKPKAVEGLIILHHIIAYTHNPTTQET